MEGGEFYAKTRRRCCFLATKLSAGIPAGRQVLAKTREPSGGRHTTMEAAAEEHDEQGAATLEQLIRRADRRREEQQQRTG